MITANFVAIKILCNYLFYDIWEIIGTENKIQGGKNII